MTQDAWPFATRDVEEVDWREMGRLWRRTGVLLGEGGDLAVTQRAAGAALQVDVAAGNAWITGHYFENDAVVEVAVPAPAVSPRIDTIAVRFDFVLETRTIVRIAGTEAATPVPPALTQNRTTKYELPLMDVYCPVGMVSVKTADDAANGYLLADRRFYSEDFSRLGIVAPVRLATAAALAASTITGNARVANANGALATIDGVAPAAGDRILDKDHATGASRGIWVVESLGSATRPWRMRRSVDADESVELRAGSSIRSNEGTTLADHVFVLTTNDPIVIGTTALTFTDLTPVPISGGTFTGAVSVPDDAYDATTWNGSVQVPTKNAVRDKIEALTAGGFTKIAETTNVAAVAISFSSIPATYRSLLLVIEGASAVAATNDKLYVRFNGDNAANYDHQNLDVAATTVTGAEALATSRVGGGLVRIPGSTAPANSVGTYEILIPDYAGTTFHKTAILNGVSVEGTSTGLVHNVSARSRWRNTAAVNAIEISCDGAAIAIGARATLYGLAA